MILMCTVSSGAPGQPGAAAQALVDAGFEPDVHYTRLPDAPAAASPSGRVEVAEFFMYSCVFCYRLEPRVGAWLEELPADVDFVRVPVASNPTLALHARAFYTARALGRLERMHTPLFREMHVARNSLQSVDTIAQFFERFEKDQHEFHRVFDSFGVQTQVQRARDLVLRFGIDQTPTFVVNGSYRTTTSMAGSNDRLFELIDLLIELERR